MFSRQKIAEVAKELADHINIIDAIRSLQTGQKELANAIKALSDRLGEIQSDLRVLKAEAKLECLRETQSIVNAVQGDFNQRLENLFNKVAILEIGLSQAQLKMADSYKVPPGKLIDNSLSKDQ